MLRAAVREGTELGRMAKKVMDEGGLVGDEIMVGIVDERLEPRRCTARGYILDGFPRTVVRPQALDEITAERPIDVVIDLDVPRELVLAADQRPAGVPRLRHELRRPAAREVAVDLRGLRWRRHASRRRHARGDQPPPRPVRGADGSADRVLPEPRPAGGRRRRRHARRGVPAVSRRPSTAFADER